MPQYLGIATVTNFGGTKSALNITSATVIKAGPGKVVNVSVLVAGSAAGSVNDAATVGAVAAANEVASIPNSVGVVNLNHFPCANGIVVTPGTGQTLAVSYE